LESFSAHLFLLYIFLLHRLLQLFYPPAYLILRYKLSKLSLELIAKEYWVLPPVSFSAISPIRKLPKLTLATTQGPPYSA
jgi:hypothetical protein